ncbi:O-antigen ligase family protein [Candidatus Aerophobetes bacterium]|nr:O-antigen ligase family protein [Candidatus Aerophobetes bacterium]
MTERKDLSRKNLKVKTQGKSREGTESNKPRMGKAQAKKVKKLTPTHYPVPLVNRIMEIGIILVVVGTPLLFSIWSKNNFLLPKETYAESILVVLFGIYLIKVVEDGRFNLVKSDLWYPLLAFMGACLISLFHSISLYLSLLDLADFLSYFFILFLTLNFIRTFTQRNRVFWALVAVCLISSIYAVCQFYNLEFKFWAREGGRGNIFSTFGNPNRYSGFVGGVLPAMIGYFFVVRGIRKYILAFIIPLVYTGMMMTFTRGALLGLFVSLLVMLFISVRFFGLNFFKNYLKSIIYLLCVFVVITAIFSTENPINYTRITLTERAASAARGQETSVRQRFMIWQISLLMAKDHPIIGQGIGTYKYHYLWYQGKYFENPKNKDKVNLAVWAREAHNEYVQILAETGIVGLFCWLWLLFTFFRGRYRTFKEERGKDSLFFPRLGLTMGALVILVHATVSFPLHIIPNGILLFLLMGLAALSPKPGSTTLEKNSGRQKILES